MGASHLRSCPFTAGQSALRQSSSWHERVVGAVAMEASVCTPSLCIRRWKQDFTEIIVVNPARVRALKGPQAIASGGWSREREMATVRVAAGGVAAAA
jgi:hypothetical protein